MTVSLLAYIPNHFEPKFSMRNPFEAPTIKELFFRGKPAADDRYDDFFPYVRLSNGSFKTTSRRRHEDLDDVVCETLNPDQDYLILDVAVSSGTTTVEWSQRLSICAIRHQMVGTDLSLWARCIQLFFWTVLFDDSGFIYQVDFCRLAFPNTPPSKLSAVAFSVGKLLIKLNRYFFRQRTQIQLLSRVAQESNVLFESGDVFNDVVPHEMNQPFDVIRASNVLNFSYFEPSEIARAIVNLRRRLRMDGLLVINRSSGQTNQFSIFRLTSENQFELVSEGNGGSEIREIVLGLPVSS